jgi:signal transduction histidine kinase
MRRTLAFAISAQAVSLIILLLLSSQFFNQLNALTEYTKRVEHTYLVINQLAQVQSHIKDAETSSRGYIITNDSSFLSLLKTSRTEFFTATDSLRVLLKDNDTQMVYLRRMERLAYDKLRMQTENAWLKKRVSHDSLLMRMTYGKVIMEKIELNLAEMKAHELILLQSRNKLKQQYENSLPRYMRTAFLSAGLLTLVFGLWIFIELKKRFRYQALLQRKLLELRQNNEELEQIAFAASHDLQEPLRKIRIFSDRLLIKTKAMGEEDNYLMSERMNNAAKRLQDLIADLVLLNNLIQNKFTATTVSLAEAVNFVLTGCKQKLNEINATLTISDLPVVVASVEQVHILFESLFNNAIQFRNPERDLEISVTCAKSKWFEIKGLPAEITEGVFYHIKVSDNGIGFDETFKSKMFKPFQRLHNYEPNTSTRRKGMGLAMCKRVMLNLGGWIDAEGKTGKGTTIHLYFPVT